MAPSCRSFDLPDSDPLYTLPLPWIGLYIAGASLFVSAFMLYDMYCSISRRRFWINPGILALNGTTIFILSIATKLPSDITTAMPGIFDQLTRLSGIVLLCVVPNHLMPSIGFMSGTEIVSNVIALGLLAVTTAVNVWMQVGVGVATGLKFYNLYFSIAMVVMFLVFVSYSLGIVPARKLLEERYNSRHERILTEAKSSMVYTGWGRETFPLEVLKIFIDKYWLLGLTSSPDYIFRSSGMSALNSIICHTTVGFTFLSALVNIMILLRDHHWCRVSSTYGWSTIAIFIIQTIAIVMGTIGSLLRSLNSTTTRSFSTWGSLFKVEPQWMQLLLGWKTAPIGPILIPVKRGNILWKLAVYTQRLALNFLLVLQVVTIFWGKLATLIHIWGWRLTVGLFKRTVGLFKRMIFEQGSAEVCNSMMQDDHLNDYILHLEENEDNPCAAKVVQAWRDYPRRWMEIGRSNSPMHLLYFLSSLNSEFWEEFRLSVDSEEAESNKNWSLPLAIIAVIARAKDAVCKNSTTPLMMVVQESFKYVRFIENNLNSHDSFSVSNPSHKTADIIWQEMVIFSQWLNTDINANNIPWIRSINLLRDTASRYIQGPESSLAADHMVNITNKMLCSIEGTVGSINGSGAEHLLMKSLEDQTAYLLANCLLNLQKAIFRRCWNHDFGQREQGVREAAILLGEVEELIGFLEQNKSI